LYLKIFILTGRAGGYFALKRQKELPGLDIREAELTEKEKQELKQY
jgi:hypothetical protein